jgi:type II secretory pathway pseudopilin PulG
MLPVLVAIVLIAIAALLAFRWFERYRYTDAWRTSEFRGLAFGFLMWFGGLFGHRIPPPPQAKIEFATKPTPPESGGPPLPDDAADEK